MNEYGYSIKQHDKNRFLIYIRDLGYFIISGLCYFKVVIYIINIHSFIKSHMFQTLS